MKPHFTKLFILLFVLVSFYGFSQQNDPRDKNPLRSLTSSVNEKSTRIPFIQSTPSESRNIVSGYLKEGFENTTFPPSGWTVYNVAGPTYTWARSTAQAHSGSASAFMRYDAASGGGQDWLVSPRFTVASTDSVVFWLRLAFQGYQPDSLSVKVSTTDSLTTSFTGTILSLREGTNYPPNATTWYRYAAYLGGYAGQNVFVAFKHANADGDGLYIDDVAIGTPPANDIAAASIDMPAYGTASSQTPKATFINNGTSSNSFPVTMTITPGGYSSTKNVTTLTSGSSQQVTFDNWTPSAAGTYIITAIAQLGTDQDRTNDTLRSSIIIYGNFTNNGWSSKTPMAAGRWANGIAYYNSGTYPNDTGFVYVISGGDAAFANSSLVSRYNTLTDTWTDMAPIPQSRTQLSAVTIGSKIYVPGGYGGSFSPVNTLSIYDIPTNTWSTGAVMPQAVGDYAIGKYGDSLLYVIGGYSGSVDVNAVQIYNVNTNTWTAGTNKTGNAVAGLRGSIIGNKIVVTGGYSQVLAATLKETQVGTIDPSNPGNITWAAGPDFPLTTGRHGAGPIVARRNGAVLNKNYVLFFGGDPNGQGVTALNTTFAFDFTDNSWKAGPNKITAVSNISQGVCFEKGDSLYMMNAGGYNGVNVVTVNEVLNLGAMPGSYSLLAPANGSGGRTLTPALDWSDAANAVSYRVQVSSNAGFTAIVKDTTVTASAYTVAGGILNYNTQYYWRVQAINALANSSFSGAFSFTTFVAPPSLVSPANGSIGQQVALNLVWNKVAGATNYNVQVSSDSLFAAIVINDTTLTDSVKSVSGLMPLTKYWWRVRGKNAGGYGLYSGAFNFKTVGTPTAVTLINPANNAVNVPLSVNFNWSKAIDQTRPAGKQETKETDSPVSNYFFELTTDTVAFANVVRDSTLADTTKNVTGLNSNTAYYWRVKAKNQIGYANFSSWFKFTTVPPAPVVPVLVSPSNGATGQSLTVDLKWNPVPFAENYRVQVATDAAFTSMILNDSLVADTMKTVSGLNTFTQYFWRVQSKNISGISAFSSVFSFTTIVSAPTAPVLVSPANGTQAGFTPLLNWDTVALSETFRVQLASDSLFNNIVIDSAGLNVTQYQVPSGLLMTNTWYYWRVNASNTGGSGNFSSAWNFLTLLSGIISNTNVVPTEFKLYNNYPNPFNPSTKIKFDLPRASFVSLKVYDMSGREVAQLVNTSLAAAQYEYVWDASGFSSGVYFYRIQTDNNINTMRMVLVK